MYKAKLLKRGMMVFAAVIFVLGGSSSAYAQNYAKVQRLIDQEKFDEAINEVKSALVAEPRDEKLYYLGGRAFLLKGEITKANEYFTKGAGFGAKYPMNYIGMGAVAVKNKNLESAKTEINKGLEVDRNNSTDVMLAAAEAYMGVPPMKKAERSSYLSQAEPLLYKVQGLDKQNVRSFVLLGTLYDLQGVEELAQMNYEKAIELDPTYIYGYFRLGQLYKKQGDDLRQKEKKDEAGEKFNAAAVKFEKCVELDPEFAPVYKELAEMWAMAQQFKKANELNDKYLSMMGNDKGARINSCKIKYAGEMYEDAIACMEETLKDTESIVLLRLIGYSYTKKKNPEPDKALEKLEIYFKKAKEEYWLASDFEMKGMALQQKHEDSLAIIEYLKAYELSKKGSEPNHEILLSVSDVFSQAAKTSATEAKAVGDDKEMLMMLNNMAGDNYLKSAEYLEQYLGTQEKYKLKENFSLGNSYYLAGYYKSDTALYKKADDVFAKMTEQFPDLIIGWSWRGRCNSLLDPTSEKGLAKPYYEKVMEIIGSEEEKKAKYKADYLSSSKYLGAYYTLITKDCEKANVYWNNILELDPEDATAKAGMEQCK